MIRYICRGPLKYRWMVTTKMFLPSQDRLAGLAAATPPGAPPPDAVTEEFSHILHDMSIRGVWRWTGRRRLRQMDRLLGEFARAQGLSRLRMLDVGASDGITALDTVEYLGREVGIPVEMTVIDRHTRLFSLRRGASTIYFTSSRHPTLLRFGRLGVCLEPMEGIEGILFNPLAARLARRCAGILSREDLSAARTIPLVNPAAARCPAIEIRERDLFDPEPSWFGSYDAVRASNVLNPSYYPEPKIREAIGVLHRYLREGGALAVSRNLIGKDTETETGGLWRRSGGGFTRIASLEAPSEIAAIIEGFGAA